MRPAQPAEALAVFIESLGSIQSASKQCAALMLEIAVIRRMEGEFKEAFTLGLSVSATPGATWFSPVGPAGGEPTRAVHELTEAVLQFAATSTARALPPGEH